MGQAEPAVWPTELRVTGQGRVLRVSFDDGGAFDLPAELLRVKSPSAEVQGHSPTDRKTVAGKSRVAIRAAEAIGNYAVKLVFDDGHDTGIYTWRFLRDLGQRQAEVWAAYLDELAGKGLSRG